MFWTWHTDLSISQLVMISTFTDWLVELTHSQLDHIHNTTQTTQTLRIFSWFDLTLEVMITLMSDMGFWQKHNLNLMPTDQVATLSLENGKTLHFYVNPIGHDKLTSQTPCCGWLIKQVQPRKKNEDEAADGEEDLDSDEDDQDDGCFMTLLNDAEDILVTSIAPSLARLIETELPSTGHLEEVTAVPVPAVPTSSAASDVEVTEINDDANEKERQPQTGGTEGAGAPGAPAADGGNAHGDVNANDQQKHLVLFYFGCCWLLTISDTQNQFSS